MPKLLLFRGCDVRPSLQAPDPARSSDALATCALSRQWLFGCVVIASSLVSSGCLFKKQPRVFNPPPIAAKVSTPDRVPLVIPTSPQVESSLPETSIPAPTVANLPALPQPPAPKPPPPKPRPPEPPPPIVVEVTPPQPTPPAAKPGQVYSAEERRTYGKDFEDVMTSVSRALTRIDSRKLNTDQQKIANQVKALQAQAEQIKSRDLATALDLAHRADLIAKDLVQHLP